MADRGAHSYIFAGADGIGKFKTAGEFGKLLLCKNPKIEEGFADSCGVCESCRLFESQSHPDFVHVYKELLEFTKDNKNKTTPVDMPIDVIREFLIAGVSNRPTLSNRRVFVVSEAEKLNANSQNSLLKVLEEPPGYCCIILLCTRLESLLPTTKSRCQIIRFGPVDDKRILEKLTETGLADKKAIFFSRLAEGSIGQACNWAKLELEGANLYETKIKIINSLADYKYEDSLDIANEFLKSAKSLAADWGKSDEATSKTDINRRASRTIVRIVISALHDAMKLGLGDEPNLINIDQKQKIAQIARNYPAEQAAEKVGDCFECLNWINASVNEKLAFERLLLNLAVCDTMKV